VYVAFTDRTVRSYDVETAQLLATLKGHHTPVYSIAVHPTQDALVTCSSDSVLMWDAQVRPHQLTSLAHPPPPFAPGSLLLRHTEPY
jgi:WD40 repeat protein